MCNLEKQKRYKGFCFCAFVYDLRNEILWFKRDPIYYCALLKLLYGSLLKYHNNVCKLKRKVVLEFRRVASVKVWENYVFFIIN